MKWHQLLDSTLFNSYPLNFTPQHFTSIDFTLSKFTFLDPTQVYCTLLLSRWSALHCTERYALFLFSIQSYSTYSTALHRIGLWCAVLLWYCVLYYYLWCCSLTLFLMGTVDDSCLSLALSSLSWPIWSSAAVNLETHRDTKRHKDTQAIWADFHLVHCFWPEVLFI